MLAALVAIGLFLVATPSTSTAQVVATPSTSDTALIDHDSKVARRANNFRGGGATVGCICGTTGRMSVVTRGGSKPTKRDFIAAGKKQGLKITKVGKIRGYVKKYAPFTQRNARRNLSRTGYTRIDAEAHHVMPQEFRTFFEGKGINIDHPKNMTLWYRPSHRKFAAQYNREWQEWIRQNQGASRAKVLQKARKMQIKYAQHYARPRPESPGCKVYQCRQSPN